MKKKKLKKQQHEKTCILKSTLKGLFLNMIIKSQQEHPLCSPILICTVRKKESNIFT